MALHKRLPHSEIHVAHAFVYADSAEREVATGFLSGDEGKLAWVQDDDSLWMLTGIEPITWQFIGGAGENPGYVQENSDWDATSGVAQILNKPTLGDAAFLDVGTSAGTVAAGNDSRFSDNRFPDLHAWTHEKDGDDELFISIDQVSGLQTALSSAGSRPARVIVVSSSGGDFTSVKAACDSITDASATKTYIIKVGPGVYTEDPFTIPPYVCVRGYGIWDESCTLQTSNDNANFINLSANATLAHLAVSGPTGGGFAAIDYTGTGYGPGMLYHVVAKKGNYFLHVHPPSYGVVHCHELVNRYSGSSMSSFIRITSYGVATLMSSSYMSGPPNSVSYGFFASGPNAKMTLDTCNFRCSGSTTAVFADDGAIVRINSSAIALAGVALHIGANGTGTEINASSTTIDDICTTHIRIDTSSAHVNFSGHAVRDKFDIPSSDCISASFTENPDGDLGGQVILGELWLSDSNSDIPLHSYTKDIAQTAWVDGGAVTRDSGLGVNVAQGEGYVSVSRGHLVNAHWDAGHIDLTSGVSEGSVCVNENGELEQIIGLPDPDTHIVLADFSTGATTIPFLGKRHIALYNRAAKQHVYFRDVVGPIHINGGSVQKHTVSGLQIDVEATDYYVSSFKLSSVTQAPATFTSWYRKAGGGWHFVEGVTTISDQYYDDGSGTLALIPSNKFKRSAIFVSVNDSGTEVHAVYGQETVDSVEQAVNNPVPPDVLNKRACLLAAVIVGRSTGDIAAIVDQRIHLGQLANSGTSVTNHGQLSGLSDNDHPQYQLVSAKGQLNGYPGLNGSGKVETSVLTLASSAPPQVTKGGAAVGTSTNLARQDHGHDVSTAAPASITPGDSATEGAATSLARSDHHHALPGFGTDNGTFCQGNDSRLSDTRQIANYNLQYSVARSSTTSSTFQNKVTLTLPAITGNVRVFWRALVDTTSNNKRIETRLYNSTNSAVLGTTLNLVLSDSSAKVDMGSFAVVALTGSSKTIVLQFRSADGTTEVGIQDAYIEIWRIS